MSYSIHWEPKGVYKKFTGHVTGQEFFQSVNQVNTHPNFETFYYVIDDFLGCAEFRLSASDLEDAVAASIGANQTNPRLVAAFLATKEEYVSTLLSVVESVKSHMRVRIFSNVVDARQWVMAPQEFLASSLSS